MERSRAHSEFETIRIDHARRFGYQLTNWHSINFATGDNIVIIPKNRPSLVEEVAKQLGYDLDAMFILKPSDGTQEYGFELPFPIPCSVRDFLTKYAELTYSSRRSVVRALSKCATDPQEREEMYQLSSKKHREKYRSYVVDQHIGFGEFISTYFQSIEMPLAKFITLCTPLQPRWYSLSGSTLMHKDEVHLTFAVVSMTRSVDSSVAQGTASHYLGSLPIGSRVRIIRSVSSGLCCANRCKDTFNHDCEWSRYCADARFDPRASLSED
jgi:sulfite reductase alpha subunit-like flavoprotein